MVYYIICLFTLVYSNVVFSSDVNRQERLDLFYAWDRLSVVEIDMPEVQWKGLKLESPPEGRCGKPYDFIWRKSNWIEIDGIRFSNAGIRKKSYCGSFSTIKPSLRLNLSKFLASNEKKSESTIGTKKLILNNSIEDGSLLRQCIVYEVAKDFGVPAPRCNMTHVFVNGDSQGLYVNVEPFQKSFARKHFGDDTGSMFEASWSFKLDGVGVFRGEYKGFDEFVTEDSEYLKRISSQLYFGSARVIDRYVPLDHFLNYWALEVVSRSTDGQLSLGNNGYFYLDRKSRKIFFIAAGLDQVFVKDSVANMSSSFSLVKNLSNDPSSKSKMIRKLRQLMGKWDLAKYLNRIDVLSEFIGHTYEGYPKEITLHQVEVFKGELQKTKSIIDDLLSTRKDGYCKNAFPAILEPGLWEDFESIKSNWIMSTQPYNNASLSTLHKTEGSKSLKIMFSKRVLSEEEKSKLSNDILDQMLLSKSIRGSIQIIEPHGNSLIRPMKGLTVDVMAPKNDIVFQVSFSGSSYSGVYSKAYRLKAGWNSVYVDLSRDLRRTEFQGLDTFKSIKFIVSDSNPIGEASEVYIDNLLFHKKATYSTVHEEGRSWENGSECIYRGSVADRGDTMYYPIVPEKGPQNLYYCTSKHMDIGASGWGLENHKSCLIKGSPADKQLGGQESSYDRELYNKDNIPECSSAAMDPDGDGLAWENNHSCYIQI